jgi:hypothetical protein
MKKLHGSGWSLAALCTLALAACTADRQVAPKAPTSGPVPLSVRSTGPRVTGNGGTGPVVMSRGSATGPQVIAAAGAGLAMPGATAGLPGGESLASATTSYLFWSNTSTGDRGFWAMSNQFPTGGGWIPLTVIDPVWSIACTADFNGDGKHDILWHNTTTGDFGYWLLNGTTGPNAQGYIPLVQIATNWSVVGCADVSNDGKPDLLWRNATTGDMGFWKMAGLYPDATGYAPMTTIPAVWEVAALADFNGDGNADVLWQNLTTGDRGFWTLGGNYPSSGWIPLTIIAGNWNIQAVTDANGDGKNDILWQNTSTGDRGWWYLNGMTQSGGYEPLTSIGNQWDIVGFLPEAPAAASPTISSVSPSTLVPGASVTITGTNFGTTTTGLEVYVGGVAATINSVTATQIQATLAPVDSFPCTPTGTSHAYVVKGGLHASADVTLQVATALDLQVGQASVVSGKIGCRELPQKDGAEYVAAFYNSSTVPGNTLSFFIEGQGTMPAGISAAPRIQRSAVRAPAARALRGRAGLSAPSVDGKHLQILEKNRAAYTALRGTPRPAGRAWDRVTAAPAVGDIMEVKIANMNGSLCAAPMATIKARVVYVGTKSVVLEDTASANNALRGTMDATYAQMGQEFDATMYDIVKNNFGDPLRMDAETDANGKVMMVFTPVINTQVAGVAGFVVSCDFWPVDPVTNGSSNFGEYFYAMVPSPGSNAYDWRRVMRSTLIHETKHIASFAAHIKNGAPYFEESWLEEGTARHAEELWARNTIFNVTWKGNTGYGGVTQPNSLYCDVRGSFGYEGYFPECVNAPFGIYRHFQALWTFLYDSGVHTPFGSWPAGDATFYGSAWSLVRFAVDKYGTSDANFLTAITQSTNAGVANLAARTGVSTEELVGQWLLAMATDDTPGWTTPAGFATWNLNGIWAGMGNDFDQYLGPNEGLSTPVFLPTMPYGNWMLDPGAQYVRAGNALFVRLAGTQLGPQTLYISTQQGRVTDPQFNARLAIVRVK